MTHILFLYYMEPELEEHWNDGLRAALRIIDKKKDFKVTLQNIYQNGYVGGSFDFVLGWGGFESPVDIFIKKQNFNIPTGLCIGGNAFPARQDETYNIFFYETSWYEPQLKWHPNAVRAFGINDDVFYESEGAGPYGDMPFRDFIELYDYTSVGSFSNWKRHEKIIEKHGNKLVIGQIQKDNWVESMQIILNLCKSGVAVSDMRSPEDLALIYNLTDIVYIPANIFGGGERAVWEAKSCGCRVEIEGDNPKLQSLLNEEPTNQDWYASALIAGIKSCLK